MPKMRIVLALLILLAVPAQLAALPPTGHCDECVRDPTNDYSSSCEPDGSPNWAGCEARRYCEINGDGHQICWYDCTGNRCLWV